jgi:tetratricopeptide (TPR) repeat protein
MTTPDTDYMIELLRRLQSADRATSRRMLADAIDAHPGDARPLVLLASEFVHAKELDRAEATYTTALHLAPDLAIARFQLGLLQLTSGRPAAAQATWLPLDLLDENDPLRLFKAGLEYLAQDRFDETRRLLANGISRNRSNPALNRDMQLVLDRIAAAGLGSGGASPPAAGGGAEHVLVSTYRNTK